MAFGDIRRAIGPPGKNGAKIAGFMLGYCFIDCLAGFLDGQTEHAGGGNKTRFIRFVKEYLTPIDFRYDSESLYVDLRCRLVHSYVTGTQYVFTDNAKLAKHFQKKVIEGRTLTVLNLEDFVNDLEKAYKVFIKDVETNDKVFRNSKKRYEALGLMTTIRVQ